MRNSMSGTKQRMSRRYSQPRLYHAAWLLLMVLSWVAQPLGTELFCHDDFASAHASAAPHHKPAGHHGADHHTVKHSHDHGASHSHGGMHSQQASTPVVGHAGKNVPAPAQEECCCEPHETPVTVASVFNFSAPDKKSPLVASNLALVVVAYQLQAPPTISSRAGPDEPIPASLLRRSTKSNRAPPLSA